MFNRRFEWVLVSRFRFRAEARLKVGDEEIVGLKNEGKRKCKV